MSAFCAICTNPIVGKVRREPLGRDNALVNVCASCATETPRESRTHQRGYIPNGGLPTRATAEAGARRVMGDERYEADADREKRAGLSPTRGDKDDFDDFLAESFRRHRTRAWSANGRRR